MERERSLWGRREVPVSMLSLQCRVGACECVIEHEFCTMISNISCITLTALSLSWSHVP